MNDLQSLEALTIHLGKKLVSFGERNEEGVSTGLPCQSSRSSPKDD
jgi:hypothetical protein